MAEADNVTPGVAHYGAYCIPRRVIFIFFKHFLKFLSEKNFIFNPIILKEPSKFKPVCPDSKLHQIIQN